MAFIHRRFAKKIALTAFSVILGLSTDRAICVVYVSVRSIYKYNQRCKLKTVSVSALEAEAGELEILLSVQAKTKRLCKAIMKISGFAVGTDSGTRLDRACFVSDTCITVYRSACVSIRENHTVILRYCSFLNFTISLKQLCSYLLIVPFVLHIQRCI